MTNPTTPLDKAKIHAVMISAAIAVGFKSRGQNFRIQEVNQEKNFFTIINDELGEDGHVLAEDVTDDDIFVMPKDIKVSAIFKQLTSSLDTETLIRNLKKPS